MLFTIGLYLGPLFIVLVDAHGPHLPARAAGDDGPAGRGRRLSTSPSSSSACRTTCSAATSRSGSTARNPGNAFALFDGADAAEVFGYVATFVGIRAWPPRPSSSCASCATPRRPSAASRRPWSSPGLVLLLLLLASVVLDTAGANGASDAFDYAAVAAFAILPYALPRRPRAQPLRARRRGRRAHRGAQRPRRASSCATRWPRPSATRPCGLALLARVGAGST